MPAPKHPLIAFIDFSKTPLTEDIPGAKVVSDLYTVSLKGEESGSMKYGRENYDYQEGSLVYIAPGQVAEYAQLDGKVVTSGWSLFFHPDLIRPYPLYHTLHERSIVLVQPRDVHDVKGVGWTAQPVNGKINVPPGRTILRLYSSHSFCVLVAVIALVVEIDCKILWRVWQV